MTVTKQQQLIENNPHHLLNVDYCPVTGPDTLLSFNLLNSQNNPLILAFWSPHVCL